MRCPIASTLSMAWIAVAKLRLVEPSFGDLELLVDENRVVRVDEARLRELEPALRTRTRKVLSRAKPSS